MITAKLKKRPTLKAVATKPYQGKGYAEGYEIGHADGYTEGETAAKAEAEARDAAILTDCNAVLPGKGVETAETLAQVPRRIEEIDYMPNPLLYATVAQNLYQNARFPEGYDLTVICVSASLINLQNMFYKATGIRRVTLDIQTERAVIPYNLVRESSVEEVVLPDGIRFTNWTYFGYGANNLKRIIGRIDCAEADSNKNSLNNCPSLVEVSFVPYTIKLDIHFDRVPNLSAESTQSIIDGLADLTGQTAQTLILHATVGAKLTNAQKATITAKNWTLVY